MNSRPAGPLVATHRGLRRRSGPSRQLNLRIWIKQHSRFLLVVTIIITLSILSKLMIDSTLLAPVNTIKTIVIDPQTAEQLQDPGLYAQAQDILSGRNVYLAQRRDRRTILKQLQSIEPFIQSISITKDQDGVGRILLVYHQPDIVIINGIEHSVRRGNHHIILSSGDLLGSGASVVYLPSYLSGAQYTTGLFFEISPKQLNQIVLTIQQAVPEHQRIVRFPGGRRILIETTDRKRVFISLSKDLEQQFYKRDLLKSLYADYARIQQIDLGSQETLIIR